MVFSKHSTSNGTSQPISNFEGVYSNAVNRGFGIFGETVAKIVTDYVNRKYGMKAAETFEKPELLSEALEKTLGLGAVMIEKHIVRDLRAQLSVPNDGMSSVEINDSQDFSFLVHEVRKQFESRSRTVH